MSKLRDDLIVSRQETASGMVYVLKDPRTARFFRLQEIEYAIARRLDGSTPLADVARAVAVELGVEADEDALRPFVEQLRSRGLLEAGSDDAAPYTNQHARGNILWFRIKAFDPDRLFDWLIPKIGFLFTRYYVVGAIALIGWAILTAVMNAAEIQADLTRLWRVESLVFAWFTILAVTTLHEFAHGLTCKRFGGHVHEIGFLLIYFQPAFYCNISDAWLFPEKSRRLWVTAAGGFFELTVWGLATLVWRITERGVWVSDAALIVMATSGIKQFFNLNPLIKLDGYYLLSDWLEIPNLRQRAFQYVGDLVKRAVGAPRVVAVREPTPRERRLFLGYGLLAVSFSYWLLTVVFLRLANWFTSSWQGWGFMLSTALFAAVVGSVTGKSLLRWPAWLSPRNHRVRLAALVVGVLGLLYIVPVQLKVGGEFEVAPGQNADIRAQVEGTIAAVFVKEGARVTGGDTLARLSDRDLGAQLRMAEAQLGERRAQLRLLEAGPRPEEIEVARLAVAKAEGHLRLATQELERMRALAAREAASREELERAEGAVAVRTTELAEERGRVRILTAGSRPEAIAAMREEIARAEAELEHLKDQVRDVWVTASHGGVVTTPKLHERVGEYVKPGDLIAEVHALETVTAEIAVSERDIGDVAVGQRGAVRLRAFPERTFEGRVTAIAPAAGDVPGMRGKFVKVTIELPNPEGRLKPQMSGYARIYCGERPALDALTRRFRRFIRVEFWSWW
ncbi:MAG: PqqD family peptide modification chaperone [Gemmatimonadales bacterium]